MPIQSGKTQIMFVGPERSWPHYRALLETLERVAGYGTVVHFRQSDAMLHLDRQCPPQAIILVDYDHGWDGLPFVRAVRQSRRARRVPLMVLSTNADARIPDRRPQAMAAGATAFYVIPDEVNSKGLVADIQAALAVAKRPAGPPSAPA